MEQTEGYSSGTLTSRVVTGDYDGDGRQEAYAILEEPEDDMGTAWAHVYYISPNGYIIYMRGYTEAGVMYASGVSSLSATDASRLLKGSWTLTVNRTGTTDMRLKFADFSSGSVDAAIQSAIKAGGLTEAAVIDAGTDDAGNTYQSGTIDANGTTYKWRVSAIPLSSVYKINGLPDTAIYVGIRMTK